jgi:hypothetical protein
VAQAVTKQGQFQESRNRLAIPGYPETRKNDGPLHLQYLEQFSPTVILPFACNPSSSQAVLKRVSTTATQSRITLAVNLLIEVRADG